MSKCIICNNKIKNIEINKLNYSFCDRCLFLKKDLIPNSLEEKKRYLNHIIDNDYYNYMNDLFLEFKKYLNEGLSLDFGCGQKNTLEKIFYNNDLLMNSYDKYFYDFNYMDYKYSNIILIEVIEHLDNPLDVLKQLKKLLNKNGKILIYTNLHNNEFNNWWYLRDITHISFFNLRTFYIIKELLNFKNIINKGNLIILQA